MISTSRLSQAMLAWLTSSRVVLPDGAVMSWVNPKHPGYPYAEISGLLLALLARYAPETTALRQRIVNHLSAGLSRDGGVTRWENAYVFDSAMVLAGILADTDDAGSPPSAVADSLYSFIAHLLTRRVAVEGPTEDPLRWSNMYGVHLLKVAIAVTAYAADGSLEDQRAAWTLLEQLVTDLAPLQTDGRFRIHARSQDSYLHAHCYATEGLLCLRERGFRGLDSAIDESAAWLADIQRPEGGLRAWHNGRAATGAMHADASAQAIRIWQLVDADRFAREIERGLDFLAGLTDESGGVRYSSESNDINTWATIFTWQAVTWADRPAQVLELV